MKDTCIVSVYREEVSDNERKAIIQSAAKTLNVRIKDLELFSYWTKDHNGELVFRCECFVPTAPPYFVNWDFPMGARVMILFGRYAGRAGRIAYGPDNDEDCCSRGVKVDARHEGDRDAPCTWFGPEQLSNLDW